MILFFSTKGVVEVTYSSGRVMISSKEEQTVIRKSRTGHLALLEEEVEEEEMVEEEEEGVEWMRVNGRLKRVPNSSTSNASTTGEKVIFWLFLFCLFLSKCILLYMYISGNSESCWCFLPFAIACQVVVASLGQQSTKVEKWGLGKLVVKQVILHPKSSTPILT